MVAIQNQLRLMCSVHSTAHFKEKESFMTCLTQAHRDHIVGMQLTREKWPIATMHFGHIICFVKHVGKEVK